MNNTQRLRKSLFWVEKQQNPFGISQQGEAEQFQNYLPEDANLLSPGSNVGMTLHPNYSPPQSKSSSPTYSGIDSAKGLLKHISGFPVPDETKGESKSPSSAFGNN